MEARITTRFIPPGKRSEPRISAHARMRGISDRATSLYPYEGKGHANRHELAARKLARLIPGALPETLKHLGESRRKQGHTYTVEVVENP